MIPVDYEVPRETDVIAREQALQQQSASRAPITPSLTGNPERQRAQQDVGVQVYSEDIDREQDLMTKGAPSAKDVKMDFHRRVSVKVSGMFRRDKSHQRSTPTRKTRSMGYQGRSGSQYGLDGACDDEDPEDNEDDVDEDVNGEDVDEDNFDEDVDEGTLVNGERQATIPCGMNMDGGAEDAHDHNKEDDGSVYDDEDTYYDELVADLTTVLEPLTVRQRNMVDPRGRLRQREIDRASSSRLDPSRSPHGIPRLDSPTLPSQDTFRQLTRESLRPETPVTPSRQRRLNVPLDPRKYNPLARDEDTEKSPRASLRR